MNEVALIVWAVLSAPCAPEAGAEGRFCPIDVAPGLEVARFSLIQDGKSPMERCEGAIATLKPGRPDVSFVSACVEREK